MTRSIFTFVGGAILALAAGAAQAAQSQPVPLPAPRPLTLPSVPDPNSIITPVDPGSVPAPNPPNPPNPPSPPDPGILQLPTVPQGYQAPTVYDSYHVMCEQGGLSFELKGGLLYLDPDTLQITSLGSTYADDVLGPVENAVDIPDRYEAANCSPDGGRTWGRVILDFYVPNYGESSVVHTGYEDVVLGDQSSDESEEFPASQEADLNAFFEAMVGVLGDSPGPQAIGTPVLPTLPSPLYTIDVKYKGPAGQYISMSAPGVVGVPTVVPVVNGNGNQPETFVVQIGPSQTASADGTVTSSGYALKIQRVVSPNVTATCNALEADVSVRIGLANPQDPGYPNSATGSMEFGYRTIGVVPRATAPSTFEIKYESATATTGPTRNDFFVAVTQVPSCNADALKIVGHFVDRADPARTDDDVDLTLDLLQPVLTDWTLARKTDPSYKMLVTSRSPKPLGTLRLNGQNKGKQLDTTVGPIPESVTACMHQGNQCNAPWRMDRASEISFSFRSRDAADHVSPLTVHYAEGDSNSSLDLLLTLSDLSIDSYIGRFSWRELPGIPFVKGDYPKWFYIDTLGNPISGYYHSASGKHHLNIELGSGTRIWGREVVAAKKKWGTVIRVDKWGRISCSGFSIDMDGVPPPINGRLLGAALCY